MKTKTLACIYIIGIFLTIFLVWSVCNSQTYASSFASISPFPMSYGGMHRNISPVMMISPPPQFPNRSGHPLISAQQACMRKIGWNWRNGEFAMCFKLGHDACPSGHPWMRQITQHYTVCLGLNNPAWVPPGMNIY